MSSSVALPTTPRAVVVPQPEGEAGAAASVAHGRAHEAGAGGSLTTTATAGGSPTVPWLAASGTPTSWLVSALSGSGNGAGYAVAARSASTTSGAGASSSGAASSAAGDWAFLSDPSLSVEEKLARFMIAVQRKIGDELTSKMEDYRAKYGEGGTETTKKEESGGFLSSIVKAIFPAGSFVEKIVGGLEDLLAGAAKSLGGPLLAALATAVGLPMLAPAALKVGNSLGGVLADGIAGGKKATTAKSSSTGSGSSKTTSTSKSSATKSSSSTTSKGEAGSPDERLDMLEIQRMVEKQSQMFTLVSNVMKNLHETAMVAIQNVR